ncbi:hypothetical protein ASC94_11340 [Massilia sp. Root418]|uniref:hypothetical protein n=1 Tax=Massilia sp. Root418 TaxID=1736532 RepID=UPI0006F59FE8|nr:hypothetical protein [Massilia sp. Root418]KQW93250.1 hypothetical protein ASC94_11340 [Massilia sp. Root418]
MGLLSFVRRRSAPSGAAPGSHCAELGRSVVAMRLRGEQPGSECVQVVFSEAGQSRRAAAAGARAGEVAYGFHPGPYGADIAPFAAAPEVGLRVRFVVDAADPRVAQQRFDLYLFSEVAEVLTVAGMQAAVEGAVQEALAQGMLDLPPCASLDEWNGFRAGLNQLLYTRFGITVEDCLPVDLGGQADYAAQLRARATALAPAPAPAAAAPSVPAATPAPRAVGTAVAAEPPPAAAMPPTASAAPAADIPPAAGTRPAAETPPAIVAPHYAGTPAAETPPAAATSPAGLPAAVDSVPAADDVQALRRLFLELPVLSSGLRQVALPAGQALFLAHRSLLQRIALIALDVNTMPALDLAAPSQPLPAAQQARRARHSIEAARALDQAWALLARLQLAANPLQFGAACGSADPEPILAALLDDADRIVSNLDHHLAQRRSASAAASAGEPAPPAQPDPDQRREPSL